MITSSAQVNNLFLDECELVARVREKLLTGWVLVTGDNSIIIDVENGVYPPGTAANRDFALVLCPNFGRLMYFYLARKTPKLLAFLRSCKTGELTDAHWKLCLELQFFKIGNKNAVESLSVKDPVKISEGIERILNQLQSDMK